MASTTIRRIIICSSVCTSGSFGRGRLLPIMISLLAKASSFVLAWRILSGQKHESIGGPNWEFN